MHKRPKLWALIEASTEKPDQRPDDECGEGGELITECLADGGNSSSLDNRTQKEDSEPLPVDDLKKLTKLTLRDCGSNSFNSEIDVYEKFVSDFDPRIGTPVIEMAELMNIAGSSIEDMSEKRNTNEMGGDEHNMLLIRNIFRQKS